MKLVYKDTRKEVAKGDHVTLRDNVAAKVVSVEKPRHDGSTGRVYVRSVTGYEQGYYPSVINAEWIDHDDQD